MIDLGQIVSTYDNSITFNGISVQDSTVGVLKISNVNMNRNINQEITINDLVVDGIDYMFSNNLIHVSQIESSQTYQVVFNRLKMKNLHFESRSNLMFLQHQVSESVEVND